MRNVIRIFRRKAKVLLPVLAVALVAAGSTAFVDNYFEITKNLEIFQSLFKELNIYYVDETDPGKLMKTGIDKMLESLDPFTVYIPESEMENHRFTITGQYGGIGALIRQKGDYVVITEPYEDYPAHKAGLKAGDAVLAIDGKSMKGKGSDDVSRILKGQPGTSVELLIERTGEEKPFQVKVVRQEIQVKSVPYYGLATKGIGYIALQNFTNKASSEVKQAMEELERKEHIRGLILDLRDNPGGLLREAVDIANLFLERGTVIVSTRGRTEEWNREHKALNETVDLKIPVVLLVGRRSASASEIVAGALQDYDRGVILGGKTFGKGLVQQTRELSYNAQLKLTTAKYYIPSGRCIQSLDYSHRREDGNVTKVPDSLIHAFKTKNGRTVYDGGGISPDIVLPEIQRSRIAAALETNLILFDYANEFARKNPAIPPPDRFEITDETYSDFILFLQGRKYDYTLSSEKELQDLKKAAKRDEYFQDIAEEYENISGKVARNKEKDLQKFSAEIKELLREEIVSRYYFNKGRIQAKLSKDPQTLKAIGILNDSTLYSSVLNGTYRAEPDSAADDNDEQ